jgi:hypothetical protein
MENGTSASTSTVSIVAKMLSAGELVLFVGGEMGTLKLILIYGWAFDRIP